MHRFWGLGHGHHGGRGHHSVYYKLFLKAAEDPGSGAHRPGFESAPCHFSLCDLVLVVALCLGLLIRIKLSQGFL